LSGRQSSANASGESPLLIRPGLTALASREASRCE